MKNVIKHHQHTNYCIIMMKKNLFENIYPTTWDKYVGPTTWEKKNVVPVSSSTKTYLRSYIYSKIKIIIKQLIK